MKDSSPHFPAEYHGMSFVKNFSLKQSSAQISCDKYQFINSHCLLILQNIVEWLMTRKKESFIRPVAKENFLLLLDIVSSISKRQVAH
jgi:hypothetical protein